MRSAAARLRLGRCLLAICALTTVSVATAPSVPPPYEPGRLTFAGVLLDLSEIVLCVGSLWLAVATALTWAGALLGSGSLAARAAVRISPQAWRRLIGAALGGAIVLAPVTTGAAAPGPADDPGITGLRLPDRPEGVAPALPRGGATAHVVRVHRGDTLWDIAASRLPTGADDAARAAACERWYAANRAAIGPDPDLLLPGTLLRSPNERTRP